MRAEQLRAEVEAQLTRHAEAGDDTILHEHLTDLGNAKRLVTLYGESFRYSKQHGWLVWDGRRWKQDDTGAVERYAKAAVRSIYTEAGECFDKDRRQAIANHAHRSESDARIKAMLSLARSEPEVIVTHDRLDRDPWLLNINNGTLDLRNGHLRAHRPSDLITRLSPVDFAPDSACPVWLNFLERIMGGNQDLIRFLRKGVGYSLSGSTREQCLFMLYGPGANGKTTWVNAIRALLGDYGVQTRMETLLAKRGDQIPNDVARLAGARFVSAVEVENGRRLAEGLVKQMTGGDRMTARFLHHEFFEFQPSFKLWLSFNHKPRIRGTDHAIWRRIRLVPFSVTIPPEERDPELGEKLKEELPGILAWALTGCGLWQDHGLNSPDAVRVATDDYRAESDVVAAFIDERCEVGPDAEVTKSDLYDAYSEWCKKAGEYVVTKKDLGTLLSEKGFSDKRNKKDRSWQGIRLNG